MQSTPGETVSKIIAYGKARPELVLGAVAAMWAVAFMVLHGYQDRPPFAEEANLAWHITKGYGFRSPFLPARFAPLSAWSPPLYPLVIAATWRSLGIGAPAAVTVLMVINAAFFGLIVAAAVSVSRSLFQARGPGLLAALWLAIHPSFLFGMGDFWDGFMSLAMFSWLCAGTLRCGRTATDGKHEAMWGGVLGAGMGLLALTNTAYAPTFPVLIGMAFLPLPKPRRWRPILAACGICLVLVMPWTIRNYVAFGRLIPIRTGGGVQLRIGNAPVSTGWLDDNAIAMHPFRNPAEQRLVLAMGEPAYDDMAFAAFWHAYRADPILYLKNCGRRGLYLLLGNPADPFFLPLLPRWRSHGLYWDNLMVNGLVALFGIHGLAAAYRRVAASRAFPWLAATVSLPFVFTAVCDRYSFPLRWILIIFAADRLWAAGERAVCVLHRRPLPPDVSSAVSERSFAASAAASRPRPAAV